MSNNAVSEPIQAESVNIWEATLEQLLGLLEGKNSLPYCFDRNSTEEALSRLDELTRDVAPFGKQAELVDLLRSHLKFNLRTSHAVDRPELSIINNFADVLVAAQGKYRNQLSLEDYIDAVGSTGSILTYSGEALLGAEMKQRQWLLEPLIKQESSVMLYADAGVGKTWLSWELIVTIAGGSEFAGWKAVKPRRVLVVDGEMNASELRERFSETLKRHTADKAQAATQNISVIPRQAQHWKTKFYDLDKPEYQEMLLKRLEEAKKDGRPYELLVLDNFSCLADVEDENSAAAFNGICQFLNRAKTMTTVLLVHHTGKNSSDKSEGMTYRGSSKLGGIMEVCIALAKPSPGEKPEHRGAAFKVKLEKFRGLRDERTDPRIFSLDPDEGIWDIKASEDERHKVYLDALRSAKYRTQTQLADGLGVNKATASRALTKMKADGVITDASIRDYFNAAKELAKGDEDLTDYSAGNEDDY